MECKLYPHKKTEITSIQEVKQTIGWQISAFSLPDTWLYTQGEGVTIAVLDTGCAQHDDLQDNVLEGFNVIDPTQTSEDKNDHGTFVTGAICALNNDLGMIGVAPKAKVVPIKVLNDNGIGDLKNVAKGIDHGIERKVDMMCLSLGSVKPLAYLRRTIKRAHNLGIPIFCAGGNIRKDMDALYPAKYPETIAIAALDKNFKRADFSNTSRQNIDFLAPGVDILSTIRNNWYATFSGSSTATPFAVGVAALMLSAKRQYNLNTPLNITEDYRISFRDHGANLNRYDGDKLFAGYGIIEPSSLFEWLKTN